MIAQEQTFNGVVHGRTIQLDREAGLPEGASVSVTVRVPISPAEQARSLEALKRAFGGWAQDESNIEDFLREVRQGREDCRPELE